MKYFYKCDQCGFELIYETDKGKPKDVKCPNCKIKLEEEGDDRQGKDIKVS